MAEPTYEELKAKLAELEKQGGTRRTGSLEFRVGEKGGVSVYGLGRFPVTLYYEQWIRLLEAVPQLKAFLEENKESGKMKLKEKKSRRPRPDRREKRRISVVGRPSRTAARCSPTASWMVMLIRGPITYVECRSMRRSKPLDR